MTNKEFQDLFLLALQQIEGEEAQNRRYPQIYVFGKPRYDGTQSMIRTLLPTSLPYNLISMARNLGWQFSMKELFNANDTYAVFLTISEALSGISLRGKTKGSQVHLLFALGHLGHSAYTTINQKASGSTKKIHAGFKQKEFPFSIMNAFYEGAGFIPPRVVLFKDMFTVPQLIEHFISKGGE